jgi:hypothetical protein
MLPPHGLHSRSRPSPDPYRHLINGSAADVVVRGDGDEEMLALVAAGRLADDDRDTFTSDIEPEAAWQPPAFAQCCRREAGGNALVFTG